jgi:hypothetical protein
LLDSSNYGFPRIFGLIRSILYHQNYLLNLDDFETILNDFQQQAPLTMGELWSIPIFIRFGLLEKLAQILVEDISQEEKSTFKGELPDLPQYPKPSIEPTSDDQASPAELIGNLIRSLRVISETDWEEIFDLRRRWCLPGIFPYSFHLHP